MNPTPEQEKRARRAKALKAKADSSTFPEERDSLLAKVAELEQANRNSGYSEPVEKEWVYDLFREEARKARIRTYQEYVREHGERGPNCICGTVEQRFLGNECPDHPKKKCECNHHIASGHYDWHCSTHGYRVSAPGGSASSYSEYKVNDDGSFTKKEPTHRTRTSHSECYATGAHDNSKAGRAACRRGRV